MWQRFTERARRVILFAQEEASKMDSGFVGSEHFLLGILREPEGVAAQILLKMGVGLSQVRTEIEATSESVGTATSEPKLTTEAKNVLELAADEARRIKHTYIGTEHLLLALLREKGAGSQILHKLGLQLEETRHRVAEYLGPALPPSLVAATPDSPTPTGDKAEVERIVARIQNLEGELASWRALVQTFKIVIQETERDWPSAAHSDEDNFDFANVKAAMQGAGTALIFIGEGTGNHRALDAAQVIISAPLFKSSIGNARKLLVSVTAGDDLAIGEVEEIVRVVREASGIEEANVFWGVVFKPEPQGSVSVTVVATGFDHPESNVMAT